MKFIFLMVGKTTDKSLQLLIQDYHNRLRHYLNFDVIVIPELKNAKKLSVQEQKEKEADLILKYIEKQDEIILLDEKGAQLNTVDFSKYIEKKLHTTLKRIVFVVGGPYGFSEDMYEKANAMLSMSQMTFSHQMIRLIFIEQLYRSMTIIRGEQYHHA